jgi:FMN phosphatase YigB (HAD superfamily)
MYKYILFDLDGTLLPLDIDVFVQKYFEAVTPFFKDFVEPEVFLKNLISSTEAMINNPGGQTNEEVFMNSFLPAVGQDRETMYPRFNIFYEQEFPKLKKYAGYSDWAAKVVGCLVEKGYSNVLATNPLFPRLAIEERMSWEQLTKTATAVNRESIIIKRFAQNWVYLPQIALWWAMTYRKT